MVFYPLIFSFWLSVHSFEIRGGAIRQEFLGLDHYAQALSDPGILGSFVRTAQYGGEGILLSVGIALGIALILNEPFKGRGTLRVLALLPWAVSEFMTGVSWKWIWVDGFGLADSFLLTTNLTSRSINYITTDTAIHLLALAEAWHVAPIGAFFLLAGLQVIPEDLFRQARIDGAGAFRRFVHIKLPFIRYALLITFVISTLFVMEALDVVLLLTAGGPGVASQTLTYQVYKQTFALFDLGYGAAVSYLLLGFVISVALVWFRLLTRRGAAG